MQRQGNQTLECFWGWQLARQDQSGHPVSPGDLGVEPALVTSPGLWSVDAPVPGMRGSWVRLHLLAGSLVMVIRTPKRRISVGKKCSRQKLESLSQSYPKLTFEVV